LDILSDPKQKSGLEKGFLIAILDFPCPLIKARHKGAFSCNILQNLATHLCSLLELPHGEVFVAEYSDYPV
jgi:hypothetical protein